MAILKIVLTPQPAVARARSGVAASSSESTLKSQLRLDGAFVQTLGQMANVLVALLTPAALLALVLGLWRVCADLGWAGAFVISSGFFSHWQVWIALSIGLKMLSSVLIAWGSRSAKFSQES
jgi:hypothetical protein